MKTAPTSFAEVFAQLKRWVRTKFARHGSGENQFGVKLGDLPALAIKLKTNHRLALALWATGNTDARLVDSMLLSPAELSVKDIEAKLKPLTYFRLVESLSYKQCIALGERLGRFDPTPVPKGCVASYEPEWIAAVLARK